jgi:hypothetical protein
LESDEHPVKLFVKINLDEPGLNAVTIPALFMDATVLLLLDQVPPEDGSKLEECPIHKLPVPFNTAIGFGLTTIGILDAEEQPALDVNIKVAIPFTKPVTRPLLFTEATVLLLLCQEPPEVGFNCEVLPTQILLFPVIDTVGIGLIVTAEVELEVQLVVVSVNIKVAEPTDNPFTMPKLFTDAIVGFEDIHIPPVEGLNVV